MGHRCYHLLVIASLVYLEACSVNLPDEPSPVTHGDLQGVQLVETALSTRTSCASICDAFRQCGFPMAACEETCREDEQRVLESRASACASAIAERNACALSTMCPANFDLLMTELEECHETHIKAVRDACVPPRPELEPENPDSVYAVSAAVCATFCNRLADCGLSTGRTDGESCRRECIGTVALMAEVSPTSCGVSIVDALTCAQRSSCEALEATSESLWHGAPIDDSLECHASIVSVAKCSVSAITDVPIADVEPPTGEDVPPALRFVAACEASCQLSERCGNGVNGNSDACIRTCLSELDTLAGAGAAGLRCDQEVASVQFCTSRLTCGEYTQWLSAQIGQEAPKHCLLETLRLNTCQGT